LKTEKAKTIGPADTTLMGQVLGDSVVGSCWRAAEQAAKPEVEVRIYVRSLAEALVAFDMTMNFLATRRLLPSHGPGRSIDVEAARKLAREHEALVAVELSNGSLVVFKQEQ
jgi:hypothetical protein